MYCSCSPKCNGYVGIFEQVGNFSYLWAVVECSPESIFFLSRFLRSVLCCICRFILWSRCFGKVLLLAIVYIISHSLCLFSGFNGRECILDMWNLKAAILCSIG